jgi:hypothetical protein
LKMIVCTQVETQRGGFSPCCCGSRVRPGAPLWCSFCWGVLEQGPVHRDPHSAISVSLVKRKNAGQGRVSSLVTSRSPVAKTISTQRAVTYKPGSEVLRGPMVHAHGLAGPH